MYESLKRKLKRRPIKVVPLSLALLLIFGLISQASVGAGLTQDNQKANQQVVDPGGSYYYAEDGKQADASNYAVRVSKTVAQTDRENHFVVDLEVETPSTYKEVKQADTAVVLVLDVSGSMGGECSTCGDISTDPSHSGDSTVYYCKKDDRVAKIVEAFGTRRCTTCGEEVDDKNHYSITTKHHEFVSRMVSAKAALKNFLSDYMENVGEYKRYFSIVTYSDPSEIFLNWTDTSNSNKNELFKKIDDLKVGTDTQTQLGMKKALTLLNQNSVANMQKSLILMTDGQPSPSNASDDIDPMFQIADIPVEFQTTYGEMINEYKVIANDYTSEGRALRGFLTPAAYAFKLRSQGIPVYTVGFISGPKASIPLTWLSRFATKNYDAGDAIKLEDAFTELISLIDTRPDMVKDSLPSYFMFDRFHPSLSNATFDQTTSNITWTFPGTIPDKTENGKNIYHLSYYVTLNNTVTSNTEPAMNENAPTFYFGIYKDGQLSGRKHTVQFPIPKVKSYFAPLTFVKTDNNGVPIIKTGGESGEFTLKLLGENNVSWARQSNNNGKGEVTFLNIPSGHTYELTETKAPTGYEKTDQVFRVTTSWGNTSSDIVQGMIGNGWSSETKTLSIQKNWVDATKEYEKHTVQFQVKCKDGNQVVRTVSGSMTKADQTAADPKIWKTTIEVPTINPDTGRALSYEISEKPIANYTTTYGMISKNADASAPQLLNFILTIRNERLSKQDFVVEKVWVDIDDPSLNPDHTSLKSDTLVATPSSAAPRQKGEEKASPSNSLEEKASPSDSIFRDATLVEETIHPDIRIKLYQGSGATPYEEKTISGSTSTTGSVTFKDVPLFDAQGNRYVYTITETSTDSSVEGVVTGYDTTQIESLENGYRITNTTKLSPFVTVPVHKHWYDDSNVSEKRPESIDVILYADRQDGNGLEATGQTITLGEEDALNGNLDVWASSFTQLPRYTEEDPSLRKEILYSVKEDTSMVPDDYEVTYSGIDIRNTLKTTAVTVRKVWEKPEEVSAPDVTFRLLQNGAEIDRVTLSSGTTMYTFQDLPKKDVGGDVYHYTIEEDLVEGYKLIKADDNTFINRIQETSDVTVSGQIRWDLRGDPETVLPNTIKIQLYSGTTAIPNQILTISKDNDWKFEFTNLPRYTKDGLGFVPYSVRELGDGDIAAPDKSTILLNGISFGAHYDPIVRTQEGNFICNIFNHSDAEASGIFSSRIVLHYDAYRNDILSYTKVTELDTRSEESGYDLSFHTNDYRTHGGKTYIFQKGTLVTDNSALHDGSNTVHVEKSDRLYEIHLYYTLHETGEVEDGGGESGGGTGGGGTGGGGSGGGTGGGGSGGGTGGGGSGGGSIPTAPVLPESPPNAPLLPESPPESRPNLPQLTPEEQERFDKVVEDAIQNPDTIIRTPEELQEKYPELDINDLPVPLYACPEFVVIMTPSHEFVAIDESLIPLSGLPKTGDTDTLDSVLPILLGGGVMLYLGCMVVIGFRKEEE